MQVVNTNFENELNAGSNQRCVDLTDDGVGNQRRRRRHYQSLRKRLCIAVRMGRLG